MLRSRRQATTVHNAISSDIMAFFAVFLECVAAFYESLLETMAEVIELSGAEVSVAKESIIGATKYSACCGQHSDEVQRRLQTCHRHE